MAQSMALPTKDNFYVARSGGTANSQDVVSADTQTRRCGVAYAPISLKKSPLKWL